MEGGVIDAGEVAGARWLVFFWAKSEGVYVDTGIWGTSVVLVWLDKVEVGAFTFREAVLAVKLELSGDNWVFAPAVHVKRGFAEYEGTGIGYVRLFSTTNSEVGVRVRVITFDVPHVRIGDRSVLRRVKGTRGLEETVSIDELVTASDGGAAASDSVRATERVDGVGEGINGISVVERLGTKSLVEELVVFKR